MIAVSTVCVIVATMALQPPPWAGRQQAAPCLHGAPKEIELPIGDARAIEIRARAGNLKIRGVDGAEALTARGRACGQTAAEVAEVSLRGESAGGVLRLIMELPEPRRPVPTAEGFTEEAPVPTASLHLEIALPAGLALAVSQSWGELTIDGVAALEVTDSLGDVIVGDVEGDVAIRALGGEVLVRSVGGDVTLDKLGGETAIGHVSGSVHVIRNVAGEMKIDDVGGDVRVEQDGRGDLSVSRVRGSLTVERDDGGYVERSEIAGEVQVPPPRPPVGRGPRRGPPG